MSFKIVNTLKPVLRWEQAYIILGNDLTRSILLK